MWRAKYLTWGIRVDDPLRTSMDPSGCVVRSIQPTLPGSGRDFAEQLDSAVQQPIWPAPTGSGCANLPQ